jgi:hypothetical protein
VGVRSGFERTNADLGTEEASGVQEGVWGQVPKGAEGDDSVHYLNPCLLVEYDRTSWLDLGNS